MKRTKQMAIALAFALAAFSAGAADPEPKPIAAAVTAAAGIDEATVKLAQETLDAFFKDRPDLKQDAAAKSTLNLSLSPLEKKRYQVELVYEAEGRKPKTRKFKMRPNYNLQAELRRQLGIVLPGPKHASAYPNDLTPKEVRAGYKKLHDKLHKKN